MEKSNRKHNHAVVVAMVMLALITPASAKNWKPLISNEAGEYQYDEDSIKDIDGSRKIQIKLNIRKAGADGSKSRLLRYSVNCNMNGYLLDSLSLYSEDNLAGNETQGQVRPGLQMSTAQPQSVGQQIVDTACSRKSSTEKADSTQITTKAISQTENLENKSNSAGNLNQGSAGGKRDLTTNPSLSEPQQNSQSANYNYVAKATPTEIRQKIFEKAWSKDLFESFQFEMAFVQQILADYTNNSLNPDHRRAFAPYQAKMLENYKEFTAIINTFANKIGVPANTIYDAMDLIVLNNGDFVRTDTVKPLLAGTTLGHRYFTRFPYKNSPVNDWYDARDPKELFEQHYPERLRQFRAALSSLISAADAYEIEKKQVAIAAANEKAEREREKAERERWLQSPEGRKFTAEEEAKRAKAEEDRQRLIAAEKAKIAKEFPFTAILTCSFGGSHTNIYACFGANGGTEIELKNGSQYGLYKVGQLNSIGRETYKGFEIDLRSNFNLQAQNAHKDLILGLKIIEKSNNKVLYEKQVSQYGTIKVGY